MICAFYCVCLSTGLVYCMNYIDVNFDWLDKKLATLQDKYVLFDFPGQVELYTNENSVHSILHKLQKSRYRVRGPCCCPSAWSSQTRSDFLLCVACNWYYCC